MSVRTPLITELVSAAQSLQTLATLLNAAKGLSNYNEIVAAVSAVNTKLMEANSVALNAQEKQSSLAKQITDLEHQIAEMTSWETEIQRYKLHRLGKGVFSYVLRDDVQPEEPTHHLCTNCVSAKKKSILQFAGDYEYYVEYVCHGCSAKLSISNQNPRTGILSVSGDDLV